jgi:uncharacterized membrane protein YkoI
MSKALIAMALLAFGLGAGPGVWSADATAPGDAKVIALEQLPAAVKDTVVKEAHGATLGEIRLIREDNRDLYLAKAINQGKTVEIVVDAAGKLIRTVVVTKDEKKP